jgi:hypothetical protein
MLPHVRHQIQIIQGTYTGKRLFTSPSNRSDVFAREQHSFRLKPITFPNRDSRSLPLSFSAQMYLFSDEIKEKHI